MDSHKVPDQDCGGQYEEYAAEKYALLFAFDGLIDPDLASRASSMQRARTLLMDVIDAAIKGPASDQNVSCGGSKVYPKYRSPKFMTEDFDRARYYGVAFPLVVDWAYPVLSEQDKSQIRTVFLRWSQEIEQRGYHAPRPIGAHLDPQLIADRDQVRWSGDNYFTAHMRNLGMMAMALDPSDDPSSQLHAYLTDATETWLYIFDNLTRTDARGGALPEGIEYSPQTAAYAAQFLLALHTAGADDPSRYGPAVSFPETAFWDDFVAQYVHSLSPVPVTVPKQPDLGRVYQPAAYGDVQNYWMPDHIEVFGALAVLDRKTGAPAKADILRWLEVNTAPGGSSGLLDRISKADDFVQAVEYFLILDPTSPIPKDPRPAFGSFHFAPGKGQLLARTGWDDNASLFVFMLAWNKTDHQHADGLDFGLYRHGEWLTKQHNGYGNSETSLMDLSELTNSLAVRNSPAPQRDPSDYRYVTWQEGSQWNYVASGDPKILAVDVQPGYVYALGDATNLYNSESEGVTSVTGVSRSIIWLEPDRIIVYDRAETKDPIGFKRWWLQVPAPASVHGRQAVVTTADGQRLAVTTLLPVGASPQPVDQVDKSVKEDGAEGDPMQARVLVQAPGDPASARFLNVLQGTDQGALLDDPALLSSDDGSWQGTSSGQTAVLFPVKVGQTRALRVMVPAGATKLLVTGLVPGASYAVQSTPTSGGTTVSVGTGGNQAADPGGVLSVSLS
jgi:hypothetical protein